MPCSRFHRFSAKELQSKIGHRMWILWIRFLSGEMTIASSIIKSTAAVAIYYCQQQRKASCGNIDLSLLQCWAAALISFLHISNSAGAITIYFQRPQRTGRMSVNIALSSQFLYVYYYTTKVILVTHRFYNTLIRFNLTLFG